MKKKNNMKSRIFALFLALVMAMTMSAPVFAVDDAEAVEQDSVQLTEEEKAEVKDQTEQTVNNEKQDQEDQTVVGEEQKQDEDSAKDAAEAKSEEQKQEGDSVKEETVKETVSNAKNTAGSAEVSVAETGTLTGLAATEDVRSGAVTFKWNKYDQADFYKASYKKKGAADSTYSNPVKIASSSAMSTVFNNLARGTDYTFKVEAYRNAPQQSSGNGSGQDQNQTATEPEMIAMATLDYKTYSILYTGDKRRTVYSGSTGLVTWGINLRTALGEGNGGYAVAQGATSDGHYAYWMMASSDNQKGRVVKTDLSGNLVKNGPVVGVHHANGMTYNSKIKKLVCVGYGEWRNQITFIDPDSLAYAGSYDLHYENARNGIDAFKSNPGYISNGIAAIAYVEKYNVYVARSRGSVDSSGSNDIFVFDADSLQCIGYIKTNVNGAYPETYQSMAADDRYVYFLISPGSGQPNNRILCLDWHSDKIIPVINGKAPYVSQMWYAGNNGNPDAVKEIPIPYESEGLFYVPADNGTTGHFYVSQYWGRQHYKTVTKKVVASKKKVKKVKMWWHKKKKKWVTKKPKKKYRGKSKKKWKYKYKYKYVEEKKADYWARDDYVYDLGTF